MTPRQKQLLDFIRAYIAENGYSPSYDDMCDGIRVASKSNITRLVYSLVDHGKIKHIKGMQRSIELVTDDPSPIQTRTEPDIASRYRTALAGVIASSDLESAKETAWQAIKGDMQ